MVQKSADGFAALGHPARLSILKHIVQGCCDGTPVGEIHEALGIPASTLSHHLATLSRADLVMVERRGTSLLYRANIECLRQLTEFLWEDCCARDPKNAMNCGQPKIKGKC
jgi:DNA-binding transcriptional ArsR family regulator